MNNEVEYKGVFDKNSNLQSSWIIEGFKDETPINWAKAFAHHLVRKDPNNSLDHLKDQRGKSLIDKRGEPIYRESLTTTQLRKFFGDLKSFEASTSSKIFEVTKVKMLKPKLAYAVARTKSKNPKIEDFYLEFERAIDAIKTYEHFKNFMQLFEAVVAYHKYFEKSSVNEPVNK